MEFVAHLIKWFFNNFLHHVFIVGTNQLNKFCNTSIHIKYHEI